MAGSAAKRFQAILEPLEGGLGWVVAWLPFEVETAWKKIVRLRVNVEIAGQLFRTSLFSAPNRGGHFVLVNKKMQKAAGARVGGKVNFTISPDLEERVPDLPPELAKILKGQKALAKWFAGLSDSTRFEIAKSINEVKSPEARQRRVLQTAERIMLAMEGEKIPPPILELALNRTPAARKGWEAMTPNQRRSHLLGVFHYKSPEARTKRVGKLIDDALRLRAEKNKLH
ncbi:YdeI/OmpD-associated family protein [Granulicella sp. dw_53]|uniref:YdeI/OmpD-associated family protein n=1 Tax=Granulicella sp. dw_53 TaxID=2719792 RepID=UPI001BD5AB64|nr:YdeI/OmpD-associated family protein [Granulicella sp. dw_53]